jgi:predicted NACHT family NTPase
VAPTFDDNGVLELQCSGIRKGLENYKEQQPRSYTHQFELQGCTQSDLARPESQLKRLTSGVDDVPS